MLHLKKVIVSLAALLIPLQSAFSYGAQGHTIVGAVADQALKGHSAGKKVSDLLGDNLTLAEVATWADKIKDGPMGDKDMDAYLASHRKKIGSHTMHKMFHFTDIPFQEKAYSENSVGASDYDLVHAITDCVVILQDKQPKHAWFAGVNKRTALILLAHFVGDIHQPLHSGSGYISPSFEYVNPDDPAEKSDYKPDTGANLIKFMSGELHAYWDTGAVKRAMSAAPKPAQGPATQDSFVAYLYGMGAPGKTPGDLAAWAPLWATEALPLAAQAHQKLVITGPADIKTQSGVMHGWDTKPAPPAKDWKPYQDFAAQTVASEMSKGGFRLAQICMAIWP